MTPQELAHLRMGFEIEHFILREEYEKNRSAYQSMGCTANTHTNESGVRLECDACHSQKKKLCGN